MPAYAEKISAGADESTEWQDFNRMSNGTFEHTDWAVGASEPLGYIMPASDGECGGEEATENFFADDEQSSFSTHQGFRDVMISSELPMPILAQADGPYDDTDAPVDAPAEAPALAPALEAAPVPAPAPAPALNSRPPGSRIMGGRNPVNANIVSSLKIIVVGDSGVGKSALVRRFVEDVFDQTVGPTIGLAVTSRSIDLGEAAGSVKLDLWDSAGQERFAPLLRSYYRGAGGVIYMFDVCSRRSLDRIGEYWTGQVESNRADEATALLVGSKMDEQERRVVSQSDARALAERHGMPYIEVSSRTGAGVSDAFHLLAMAMLNSQLEADPRNPKSNGTAAPGTRTAGIDIKLVPPPKKGKCC
jgi:small GTP-binding protein